MGTTAIFAILGGLGVFIIFLGIARTPTTNTAQIVQQRLQVYGGEKPLTMEEVELQRPFSERFLRPAIERLGTFLSRSTPQKARQDLLNKLELAGKPGNLTPEDFGAVRLVSAAVLAAVGLLLGFLLGNPVYVAISASVGAVLGYYAPIAWLQQKVDARRADIQKGLPDAMDLLVIAVDAGLGFERRAMAQVPRGRDRFLRRTSSRWSRRRLRRPRLRRSPARA
jgi:tight adherence protein C